MKLDERQRLHRLSKAELQTELATAERSLLDLQFDAGLKRLTNPAALHNTRKLVATLKTLIREYELLDESGFNTVDEYKAYRVAERRAYANRKKGQ